MQIDYKQLTEAANEMKWHLIALFGLIFLLNPICSIFLCIAYFICIQDKEIPAYAYVTLFAMLACWLGCINITKLPTGDLPGYIRLFERVPERGFYGTVFESWGGTGKEPFYSFFTYVGYYLCFGSASVFFFLLTAAMYFLLFVAAYRFLKEIGASTATVLCGVVSLAFFTQYFVLTSHIVRQMLAMSIVMYAFVDRIVTGKHNWVLLAVAVLTHTSAILIALFSVFPFVYQRMGMRRILITLACFVPLVLFNTQIGGMLGGFDNDMDTLHYAVSRYASNSGDGIAIPVSLMLMVYVPLFLVSLRVLWLLRDEKEHLAYPMIYVGLLLMIFVLSFTQNPLVQYRFFYFSYAFIPMVLPLMFYGKNPGYDRMYSLCVSLFFIVRFFAIHNTSGMKFASMLELASMPFPYFFFHTFYY